MPTETELERMVIRFTGDNKEYLASIQESIAGTEKFRRDANGKLRDASGRFVAEFGKMDESMDLTAAKLRRGAEITKEVQTSAERYSVEMRELNNLVKTGAINQDTYNRAQQRAKQRYDQSNEALLAMRKRMEMVARAGQAMRNVGFVLSAAITAPFILASKSAAQAAVDADEARNKFETVFRSMKDEARAAAAELDESWGMSRAAAERLLGNTGDLLTGFGFTTESALDLSTQVQKLAVDLASFTNIEGGAAEASERLTKGILGEKENLKLLGIAINETTDMWKETLAEIEATTEATGVQAKALAVLKIAQEQSQNAMGDYSRTANSIANQQRELESDIEDLSIAFGELLTPILAEVVAVSRDLVAWLGDLDTEWKAVALGVAATAAAIAPLLLVGGQVIATMANLRIALIGTQYELYATRTAAIAAKVALGGLSAVGLILLAKQFYDSSDAVADFNRELERSSDLAQETSKLYGERTQKFLEDNRKLSAEDQKIALEEELSRLGKEMEGTRGHIDRTKAKIEEFGMFGGVFGFHPAVQELNDDMEKQQQRFDDTKASIEAYQKELNRLNETEADLNLKQKEAQANAEEYLQKMRDQADVVGMTKEEADRYFMTQKGVNDETVRSIRLYQEYIAAEEEKIRMAEEHRDMLDSNHQKLEDYIESLQLELDTFKMTKDEAALYKLTLEGVTEAQLAEAEALQRKLRLLEDEKDLRAEAEKLNEKYNRTTKEEQLLKDLKRAEELRGSGALSDDEFEQIRSKAEEEFKKIQDQAKVKITFTDNLDAVEAGSFESLKRIREFRQRGEIGGSGADPQSAQQADDRKKTNDILVQIAQILQDTKDNPPFVLGGGGLE